MAEEILGRVNSIESFGSVDGPGVRFIFFMQGCRMRCKYCHNPETWKIDDGGDLYTPEDAFKKASRYKNYWNNGGGITVSGGEPLLQIEFVTELFKIAHENGVNTALDTSANPFNSADPEFMKKFEALLEVTDLFLLDIKEINPERHKELTAWDNSNILEMAKYLSDHGKNMWIRHVLVPGVNDFEEDLQGLSDFVKTLKTVQRFEILPYHNMMIPKYEKLGIDFPLKDLDAADKSDVEKADKILNTSEYKGYLAK